MWKRHKGKIVLGVLVLAVVGFVGTSAARRRNQATEVSVAKVKLQDVVAKVTANGKIQAENKVDMSALVMGQIVNLVVREGDRVKRGDFLLQIDKNRAAAEEASFTAALHASLADLDSARATSARARTTRRRSSPRPTTSARSPPTTARRPPTPRPSSASSRTAPRSTPITTP